MSEERFDAAWLALREPADAAARSAELAAAARALLPVPLVVHDLGSGTGSMARWLGPELPGSRWVLHDRDADLLARAPVGAERRVVDLAALTAGELEGADLVTASALLDVLTADELDAIVAACAARRVPALLTLTVTGGVELDPPHSLDAAVAAAFVAHQRRAVGRRRQLGPDAIGHAVRAFLARGAAVDVRPSPWLLGGADADLAAAWLRGWVGAAAERRPELLDGGHLARYLDDRLAAAAAGTLRAAVHHADLFARWPEPVPQQHDVVDRAGLDQLRAPGAGRETARAGQPGRLRSPEQERRDDEVQLVDEPRRQERRVDGGAALDEQLPDAAPRQVREHAGQADGRAGVDDVREPGEPPPQPADRGRRGVDEPLGLPSGEERGSGVEGTGRRDRDLGGVSREAELDAPRPSDGRPHQQARVVRPDRPSPHEDRVAPGPDGVDAVEVGGRREDEPLRRGVVEVAVDGRRTAQHDDGPGLFAVSDHTPVPFREDAADATRWDGQAITAGRVVRRSTHRS